MKKINAILSLLCVLVAFSLTSCAQVKNGSRSASHDVPSKDALVKDVKDYILTQQKKNKGHFKVYDSVKNRHLKLTLEKVHSDKFSHLGGDRYFDCANFRGANGKLYDIDIFMKWNGKNFESTSKRMVHKVNNTPRYIWYEDNGIWKTKAPDKHAKKDSIVDGHPAH